MDGGSVSLGVLAAQGDDLGHVPTLHGPHGDDHVPLEPAATSEASREGVCVSGYVRCPSAARTSVEKKVPFRMSLLVCISRNSHLPASLHLRLVLYMLTLRFISMWRAEIRLAIRTWSNVKLQPRRKATPSEGQSDRTSERLPWTSFPLEYTL